MESTLTYNGTVYQCTYEIDCPGNSACYYLNKTNLTQGYCSCNVEQGTQGMLCSEISSTGYARIVVFCVDLVAAIAVISAVIYQLFLLIKVKGVSVFDVRITSSLMCSISLMFFSFYDVIILYWVLYPNLPFEEDKITKNKRRPYSQFMNISLSISLFFYITASLNVSTFWLEVAIASKRFKRINRPQLSKNYRYAVFTLDLLFAFVLGFTIWFAITFTSIAAIIIFIIILALYIYSAYQITKVMDSSSKESDSSSPTPNTKSKSINKALLLIRRFAIRYVILMILWIIFLVIGATQYQGIYNRAWKDGDGPGYIFFIDLAFLFAIAAILALVKYIHDATNNTISKSKTPANDNHQNNHSVPVPSGGVVGPALNVE